MFSRGQHAETRGCRYLVRRGLHLIERNYRTRRGEIDLIMEDGETLVFVEVRQRRSSVHGHPLETVDQRKQARIRRAAENFLLQHRRYRDRPCRFDVLSFSGADGKTIDWIPHAFGI